MENYSLNISLGSLRESVPVLLAYRKADQMAQSDVEGLEQQQDWIDHLIKESTVACG